jgi:hypothetical protein
VRVRVDVATGSVVSRVDVEGIRPIRHWGAASPHAVHADHQLRISGKGDCSLKSDATFVRVGADLAAVSVPNAWYPVDFAFIVASGVEHLALRSSLVAPRDSQLAAVPARAAPHLPVARGAVKCHFVARAGDFFVRAPDPDAVDDAWDCARRGCPRLARMSCKQCSYFWEDPDTGAIRATFVGVYPPETCISPTIRSVVDIAAVNRATGLFEPQPGYLDKIARMLRVSFVE